MVMPGIFHVFGIDRQPDGLRIVVRNGVGLLVESRVGQHALDELLQIDRARPTQVLRKVPHQRRLSPTWERAHWHVYGVRPALAGGSGLREAVLHLSLAPQENRFQGIARAGGKEALHIGKPLLSRAGGPCPEIHKAGTANNGPWPFDRRRRNRNKRRGCGFARSITGAAVYAGAS